MEKRIVRTVESEMVNCAVVFEGQREVDDMLIAIPLGLKPSARKKAINAILEEAHAVLVGETESFKRVTKLSMPLDVFVQMAEVVEMHDEIEEGDENETDFNSRD